jgi:hypothetical protein
METRKINSTETISAGETEGIYLDLTKQALAFQVRKANVIFAYNQDEIVELSTLTSIQDIIKYLKPGHRRQLIELVYIAIKEPSAPNWIFQLSNDKKRENMVKDILTIISELPYFLQPGIKSLTKHCIHFDTCFSVVFE